MVCLFRAASKQLNCRQSRRQVRCHNSFGVYFLPPFFMDFQLVKSDHGRPNGSCGYDHGGVYLFVSFHTRKYLCVFVYFFVQPGWETTCRRRKLQKVTRISRGSITAGSLSRLLLCEIWVYRRLHDVKLHSFPSFRLFHLALHLAGTF